MTAEQLRIARDANPFRPFVIRMADGRTFPVPHRDYLSVSPSGRIAIVYVKKGTSASVLDLFLMTELTLDIPDQETPREPDGDGQGSN